MTPTPQTPLSLEFTPDDLGELDGQGIVRAEPSVQEDGRIFITVFPQETAYGCHMVPDEVKRLRDHLSTLLLDPSGGDEPPVADKSPQERWEERINAAVDRVKSQKPKRRKGHFRLEFQVGRLLCVIGTKRDE